MMSNLFSIFDPSSSTLIMNWVSMSLLIVIIPMSFWAQSTSNKMIFNKIEMIISKEFSTILQNKKNTIIMFTSIFMMIAINNFLGLTSYTFTATSHLAITLSMALPLWMSLMIFYWSNKTMEALAHLVPNGTPSALIPFMVMIEMISNIIRPITLSVRLAANMIAGHLLLTLLGNNGPQLSMLMLLPLMASQVTLMLLEAAVAIIQAYVFSILGTLYTSET